MSKFQVMPALPADHYQALTDSIREHGVQVPVDVDENGDILDGHNRAAICAELSIDCPQRVVTGLSEDEKVDHAWRANTTRRQLDGLARRRLALELHGQGLPQQRIAARLGVSQATISGWIRGAPKRAGEKRGRKRRADSAVKAPEPASHAAAPAEVSTAGDGQPGPVKPLPPAPRPDGQPEGVRSCPHCHGPLDMRPLRAELDRLRAIAASSPR